MSKGPGLEFSRRGAENLRGPDHPRLRFLRPAEAPAKRKPVLAQTCPSAGADASVTKKKGGPACSLRERVGEMSLPNKASSGTGDGAGTPKLSLV